MMNSENSLFRVRPQSSFHKSLSLPTSKSHANRALILGALRGNGFTIVDVPTSSDVENMIKCLMSVGLEITRTNSDLIFHNNFPACETNTAGQCIDLHTGDGGTTNRFLMALLSRGKKRYRFFPSEKMASRPIDDLINPLRELGVDIESESAGAWITLQGPAQIKPEKSLEIDCAKSTQFASAMLLAFSNTNQKFIPTHLHASETYLQMSFAIISELGDQYRVPVDFSSLSYPAALALLGGQVTFTNCHELDPLQSDAQFIKILKDHGADVQWTKEGLLVTSKNKLRPFNADASIYPDLIPTLVFLAAHLEGESTIKNLKILRHKESDRIDELCKLLVNMQVIHSYDTQNDQLTITGKSQKSPEVTLQTARDHRIVMTAYLFLRCNSGGLLGSIDCVEKSFKNFFALLD